MLTAGPVLVAGCGYVGERLARMLAADGRQVVALRRGEAAALPGVTAIRADLQSPASLSDLPRSPAGAVFAAGPSAPDEAGYRAIFLDGLGHLIEALAALPRPPSRLVFTSSTAVYGQTQGEWVDETSPTDPASFRGRVLLEAEALVGASPIPGCVVRLGGIYGPGRARVIDQVRSGQARIHPDVKHYTNRIHRDDAAGAIRHLLELERTDAVYLGVDGRPAEQGELLRYLAQRLGLPAPPSAAPGQSARPTRAGSKRCRNDRLLATGYRFIYPTFREGYGALIDQVE